LVVTLWAQISMVSAVVPWGSVTVAWVSRPVVLPAYCQPPSRPSFGRQKISVLAMKGFDGRSYSSPM
jgi:hypothetical protein